ncbi:right-handed parallel beta-helix repeat-containing protein [Nocardioides sp. CER19]|uniref:right-handed parallel beta-helix repeat-containing protein n=1 Tax=Nocardioides sp. CER19 TaxID=3038538 RepID=UPI0024498316|nr:right-handed parallel beta-helix repeat-containing protein [Nocardioides sp. CER19]MDH2414179.1 right-handed parallel beta-helix repeat-containing protein [Nocardioides sp. CER19]
MADEPRRRWTAVAVALVLLTAVTAGAAHCTSPDATAQRREGGGVPSRPAEEGARLPTPTSGRVVNALEVGAVGDGRADDTSALQHALAGLSEGDALELPAGHTFTHSRVLRLRTPGITITGGGTLLATDERASALEVAADRITVSRVTVATAHATQRWAAPEQSGIWLNGHSDITLTDATVAGSGSAGVFVQGTQHFTLTRVTVRDTRSDGIHMTAGARGGLVTDPLTENTGDDGVAVVAYLSDGAQAGDIDIVAPHVHGQSHGRGVSVVGGRNVQITDVDIRDSAGAGVYVACERGQFRTYVPSDVSVRGGTIDAANQDPTVDHGSLLVYNGQGLRALHDVTMRNLRIHGTRASASWQVGLIADDDGPLHRITLDDLHFTGDGPARLLATNTDDLRYQATGWTENGEAVDE